MGDSGDGINDNHRGKKSVMSCVPGSELATRRLGNSHAAGVVKSRGLVMGVTERTEEVAQASMEGFSGAGVALV
jgi:hypothetical protein